MSRLPRVRRRSAAVVAGGVALVAVLVAGLVVLDPFGAAPTPARVGQLVTTGAVNAEDVRGPGAEVTVPLPPGDLVLRVGEPQDALPDTAGLEEPGVPAPDGGAFVPVLWEWATGSLRTDLGAAPGAPPSVVADAAPSPGLALLGDGEGVDLPLGAPPPDGREAWSFVATDGAAEQTFVVSYDGVEVRVTGSSDGLEVEDPGPTAAYDGYLRDRSGAAPVATLPVVTDPVTTVEGASGGPLALTVGGASREPYVTGLGWAPEAPRGSR